MPPPTRPASWRPSLLHRSTGQSVSWRREELNATVDLPLDLNTQDDTGLVRIFLDEAPDQSRVVQGAWIVVGGAQARAVVQVVSIESLPQGDLVHVRPLPGPVSDHAHLLSRDVA